MVTKSQFRKVVFQYRTLIDSEVFAQRNEMLCSGIKRFIEENEINKFHTFLAIKQNNEPDIYPILANLWKEEKQVVVSKTDFKVKQMSHYLLGPKTKIALNKKGIPEPLESEGVTMEDLDVVFVPLLVSDKIGARIGYGGGYYDQLLRETNSLKVGLSLSPPVDEILQRDEWDVPLDFLITPFKTYNYG